MPLRCLMKKLILKKLDKFNKILDDLENIDIQMEEVGKSLFQLSALPKSFENFKDNILFGRQSTINLEEVIVVLKSKELQRASGQNHTSIAEGLIIKTNHHKKKKCGNAHSKEQEKKFTESTSLTDSRKCFYCHEPKHFKKNCSKWKALKKNKATIGGQKNQANQITEAKKNYGYRSAEVLSITFLKTDLDWILDSSCSFYMGHKKEWFIHFKHPNGGSVLLGNK
ncbi:hypothetical protein ACS0TY_019134 [Phlomoides rotata]